MTTIGDSKNINITQLFPAVQQSCTVPQQSVTVQKTANIAKEFFEKITEVVAKPKINEAVIAPEKSYDEKDSILESNNSLNTDGCMGLNDIIKNPQILKSMVSFSGNKSISFVGENFDMQEKYFRAYIDSFKGEQKTEGFGSGLKEMANLQIELDKYAEINYNYAENKKENAIEAVYDVALKDITALKDGESYFVDTIYRSKAVSRSRSDLNKIIFEIKKKPNSGYYTILKHDIAKNKNDPTSFDITTTTYSEVTLQHIKPILSHSAEARLYLNKFKETEKKDPRNWEQKEFHSDYIDLQTFSEKTTNTVKVDLKEFINADNTEFNSFIYSVYLKLGEKKFNELKLQLNMHSLVSAYNFFGKNKSAAESRRKKEIAEKQSEELKKLLERKGIDQGSINTLTYFDTSFSIENKKLDDLISDLEQKLDDPKSAYHITKDQFKTAVKSVLSPLQDIKRRYDYKSAAESYEEELAKEQINELRDYLYSLGMAKFEIYDLTKDAETGGIIYEEVDYSYSNYWNYNSAELIEYIDKLIGYLVAERKEYGGEAYPPEVIEKIETAIAHLEEIKLKYERKRIEAAVVLDDGSAKSVELCNVLRYGAENLLKTIANNDDNAITADLCKTAHATALHLIEKLDKIESKTEPLTESLKVVHKNNSKDILDIIGKKVDPKIKKPGDKTRNAIPTYLTEAPKDKDTFSKALDEVSKLSGYCCENELCDMFMSKIENFFAVLPLPTDENYYKTVVDDDNLLTRITELSRIVEQYYDLHKQSGQQYFTLTQVNTGFTAAAVMAHLSLRHDELHKDTTGSLLKDYYRFDVTKKFVRENELNLDPKENKRYDEIEKYFSSINKNKMIYGYYNTLFRCKKNQYNKEYEEDKLSIGGKTSKDEYDNYKRIYNKKYEDLLEDDRYNKPFAKRICFFEGEADESNLQHEIKDEYTGHNFSSTHGLMHLYYLETLPDLTKNSEATTTSEEVSFPALTTMSEDDASFAKKMCEPKFEDERDVLLSAEIKADKTKQALSMVSNKFKSYDLLKYYSSAEGMSSLSDISKQSLFKVLFFQKSTFEEELKDLAFIDACHNFINKGIDEFYTSKPGKQADINSLLFFVGFSQDIQRQIKNSKVQVKFESFPDTIIEEISKNASPRELSIINLYHITAMLDTSVVDLTKKQAESLLSAWIEYSSSDIADGTLFRYMNAEAKEYINKLISYYKTNKTADFKEIAATISQNIVKDFKGNESFKDVVKNLTENTTVSFSEDVGIYTIKSNKSGSEFLSVDFVTGKIFCNEGRIYKSINVTFEQDKLFKELFGETHFEYTAIGSIVSFKDGAGKQMRVIDFDDRNQTFDKKLQYQYKKNWYKYIAPDSHKIKEGRWFDKETNEWHNEKIYRYKDLVPASLLDDYHHWQLNDNSLEIIFLDKADSKVKYILDKDGKLSDSDKKYLYSEAGSCRKENDVIDLFLSFEDQKHVWVKSEEAESPDQPDKIDSISFVRLKKYKESRKNNLVFKFEKDKGYFWQDNPDYKIVKSGLSVRLDEAIVLENSNKKQKVLITPETSSTASKRDYFIFDVNSEGILVPEKDCYNEGNILLAHMYLKQGRHDLAYNCLQKIENSYALYTLDDNGATVNDLGLSLLGNIINFPVKNNSDRAIALHALMKLMHYTAKNIGKKGEQVVKKYQWKSLYVNYKAGISSVSTDIMLSDESDFLLSNCERYFYDTKDFLDYIQRYPGQSRNIPAETKVDKVAEIIIKPRPAIKLGVLTDDDNIKDVSDSTEIYDHLNSIAENIFTTTTKTSEPLKVDGANMKLSETEEIYRNSIEKGLEFVNKELELCTEKTDINIKKDTLKNGIEALKSLKGDLDGDIKALEKSIERYANMKSANIDQRQLELYKEAGKHSHVLKMADMIRIFLQGDHKHFMEFNKNISEEDAKNLYKVIAQFLCVSTQCQRVTRAYNKALTAETLGEDVDAKTIKDLHGELTSKRNYTPSKNPECLVFEYLSNISMSKKQADILVDISKPVDGKFKSSVKQLVMGGGKTAVITAVECMYISKAKKVPLVVTPAPLFESTKNNLSATLLSSFNQKLEALTGTRKDLNLDNLNLIYSKFKCAQQDQSPIIASIEIIPLFELELKMCLHDRLITQDNAAKELLEKKINILGKILNFMHDECVAIFDEVDTLLDASKETNYPIGDISVLYRDGVDLMRDIYKMLSSTELEVDGKKLNDIVKLTSNKQVSFEEADRRAVFKVIADKLLLEKLPKDSPETRKKSLVNYVLGDTEGVDEAVQHVVSLYNSNDDDKDLAKYICLMKHFLTELLPSTLKKEGNRDYGVSDDKTKPGIIVPYKGTSTPSNTEFGYSYECLAYYFQNVLNCGFCFDQFKIYAEEQYNLAMYDVQNMSEGKIGELERSGLDPFSETDIAKNFEIKTGIQLKDIKDRHGNLIDKKLELAFNNINDRESSVKLDMIADVAARSVTYYKSRIVSGPQSIVDQFSAIIGITGTPDNSDCWNSKLSNIAYDEGSNGSIWKPILERENQVITDDFDDSDDNKVVSSVLSTFDKLNEEEKNKFSGIMDPGGLIKGSPIEFAQALCEKFIIDKNSPKKGVKGILFFHESKLHRMGADKIPVELVGVATLESLKKEADYNPDEYITFFDESHTRGSDIGQRKDALDLCLLDLNINNSKLLQSVMRLRQFTDGQNVKFVIPNTMHTSMGGKDITTKDIILHCEKNLAIKKSNDLFKSYRQKIDNIIDNKVKKEILRQLKDNKRIERILAIYKEYKKFTVKTVGDNPFEQFHALDKATDTYDLIKNHADKVVKLLTSIPEIDFNDKKTAKFKVDATEEIKAILEDAKQKASLLPNTIKGHLDDIGMEVQQEIAIAIETEVQVEVEAEIDNEVKFYDNVGKPTKAYQKDLEIADILNKLQSGETGNLNALKSLFSNKNLYMGNNYEVVFDDNDLFVTESFKKPYTNDVPIFNKAFYLAERILFVKDHNNKIRSLVMTIAEGDKFIEYLQKNPNLEDVWLMQSNGKQPIIHGGKIDSDLQEEIDKKLILVNAFNGNIDYLSKESLDSKAWLNTNYETKIQFLRVRTSKNSSQYKILRAHPAFNPQLEKSNAARLSMGKKEKEIYDRVSKYTDEKNIKNIKNGSYVQCINPKYINFCDVEHVKNMIKPQIEQLTEQRLIQKVPYDKVHFIKEEYYELLTEEQKKHFLNLNKIENIAVEEVGLKIKTKQQAMFLSSAQIPGLSETQLKEGWIKQEMLKHLDSKQVEHVPLGFIQKLTGGDEELIVRLADHQFKWLEDKSAIQQVPSEKLHLLIKDLSDTNIKNKLACLLPDQINGITDHAQARDLLQLLEESQINLIENKDLIPELKKTQFQWLSNDMLEHLSVPQVKELNDNYDEKNNGVIQKLPKSQVEKLTKEYHANIIKNLAEDQFVWLKDKSAIQKVPSEKLHLLIKDLSDTNVMKKKLACLLPNQINGIKDPKQARDLLQLLEESQINLIENKDLIPELKKTQFQWLSDDMLEHLSKPQVKELNDNYDEKDNSVISAIQKLPKSQVEKLTEEHGNIIQNLAEDQFVWLKDKSAIQKVPSEKLHLLIKGTTDTDVIKKKLACLSPNQINGIKDPKQARDLLQLLEESQINLIENKDLIPELKISQFQWLSNDMLEHLSVPQVKQLNDNYSEKDNDVIQNLPKSQVEKLTKEHVNIIQNLAEHQFVWLKDESAIQKVPSEKLYLLIKGTTDTDVIKKKLACLLPGQINGITDPKQARDLLQLLEESQINLIKNKDLIPELKKTQLLHIKDEMVEHVPNHMIKGLNNTQTDRLLQNSPGKIDFINDDLFSAKVKDNTLIKDQVSAIKTKEKVALLSNKMIRWLAQKEAIADLPKGRVKYINPTYHGDLLETNKKVHRTWIKLSLVFTVIFSIMTVGVLPLIMFKAKWWSRRDWNPFYNYKQYKAALKL